jgi:hypothetical protein
MERLTIACNPVATFRATRRNEKDYSEIDTFKRPASLKGWPRRKKEGIVSGPLLVMMIADFPFRKVFNGVFAFACRRGQRVL